MMHDWNVVATVHTDGFREACRLLEQYGPVRRTGFYNVLVMKVEDRQAFMDALAARIGEEPGLLNFISHVMPAEIVFDFESPADFEKKARQAALGYVHRLAGKRFHVRMRRRGFKGVLSSQVEERFLDDVLLAALDEAGTPGKIAFDDAEMVLALETVGQRAAMSLWSCDDLERFTFLQAD